MHTLPVLHTVALLKMKMFPETFCATLPLVCNIKEYQDQTVVSEQHNKAVYENINHICTDPLI